MGGLNGWYGGVNWGHVQPRYCITCAGTGKIGGHRWRYDPDKGTLVQADLVVCPRCKGTGKRKGKT